MVKILTKITAKIRSLPKETTIRLFVCNIVTSENIK